MSDGDWRELLDDPEIERMVNMAVAMAPRTGDTYLDDDRVGYLWDVAVEVAIRYDVDTTKDDPTSYWRAYLWRSLRTALRYQRLRVYAPGRAKDEPRTIAALAAEQSRKSFESLIEDAGDAPLMTHQTTHGFEQNGEDASVGYVTTITGDHRTYQDAPGWVPTSHSDPAYLLALMETVEAAMRHAEARERLEGIVYTGSTDLCADPECWAKAAKQGLCNKHYQQHARAWGVSEKVCKIEYCGRPATARELCSTHYQAWRRQDPDRPRCAAKGCERAAIRVGWCQYHREHPESTGDAA